MMVPLPLFLKEKLKKQKIALHTIKDCVYLSKYDKYAVRVDTGEVPKAIAEKYSPERVPNEGDRWHFPKATLKAVLADFEKEGYEVADDDRDDQYWLIKCEKR